MPKEKRNEWFTSKIEEDNMRLLIFSFQKKLTRIDPTASQGGCSETFFTFGEFPGCEKVKSP